MDLTLGFFLVMIGCTCMFAGAGIDANRRDWVGTILALTGWALMISGIVVLH